MRIASVLFGFSLVALMGLSATTAFSTGDTSATGSSGDRKVAGKVISIAKDTVIVRPDSSSASKEISLTVDENRAKDLAVGDVIEAQIDSSGRASSFKKTAGAQQGGGMSSSGTTGHQSHGDVLSK